ERPEEVVGFLEVGSTRVDLLNQVLNACDVMFSEVLFDDEVISDGDSSSVNLDVSSLVKELRHSGSGGVSVSHVGLDSVEHAEGSLVELDEDSVVELSESEQLEDLLDGRVDLVDTNILRKYLTP